MKTALITGSNSGIGKATALAFARAGYKTYASMRNLANADALREEAGELPLEFIALDVTDDASMRAAVSTIVEREGGIDVLVNNAGIAYGAPIEFIDDGPLRATMETNFFGATKMMQLVIPSMRARGGGAIVNISSCAGRFSNPAQGPYCASKFALEAMSIAAAAELAQFGVRVAVIEPGVVRTAIAELVEQMGKMELPPGFPYAVFLQRLVKWFTLGLALETTPADVARTVLDAVTTDTPKLRYVVGNDAAAQMQILASTSDEDIIALLAETDDELFWAQSRAKLGLS